MADKPSLNRPLELFNLEKVDRDIFSWNGKNVGYKRIFGGQVMAQTLIAAYKTVNVEHFAHSFHSYFIRPGNMEKPITFTVDRIRDGKSFTTRSVKAIQDGEVIFNCSISFQKREKGLEHQVDMPDVPEPETLKSEQELREDILKELKMKKEDMPMFFRQQEIEMRPVEKQNYFKPERMPPYKNTWIKNEGKLPDDQVIQQAFLLYISDMGLLGAANNSVGVNFLTKNLQNASLDHAMWFHRKLDLNGWFLYTIESPITRNARGFSRGSIFSRDGKLIASCTQEGLIRLWDD
jgi:acyl-CoA thioesterase-2|tara:strand:+ start:495 stop:1370 length:876 start_codon:yes stop_codon:yes gene_type:complete